ncbi:hypothetical protein R1flu_011174 [Riccia fluitans]|uniref:Uncharacterized protein n=1 Tax=Riccia fluitans TaxID=41844 RepID=A0ABD1Z731_9MARC
MPPFCVPAPPYLINTPDPAPEEEPEHQEVDGRAQVIASLVDALNQAEAAAAAGREDNRVELANQAYTSLCYDFPIVSTRGLVALHSSFKPSLVEVWEPLFPVTRNFTSGLSYLVSAELRQQGAADGRPLAEDGVEPESTNFDVRDSETRTRHLLTLSASVFLLAPALRVAVAYKDEGVSLKRFFAAYDAETEKQISFQSASPLDDGSDGEHAARVEEAPRETGNSADEAEVYDDDDDSDWEPLETAPSVLRIAEIEEESTSTSDGADEWDGLMEKVRHITSSVPKGLTKSVWEELELTKHLNCALFGLRILEEEAGVEVLPTAEIYSGLLVNHLISERSSSSVAPDLAAVISSFLNIVKSYKGRDASRASTSRQKSWESLLLIALAKLCTKIGGFPIGSNTASAKEGANCSCASSGVIRSLWQSTLSALLFLQQQLDVAVRAAESSDIEFVMSIMCFMVKYAPGNADLGSMLVGGGFFRTALSVFVKVGAGPHMEVLRQFLLISMATSSSAVEYAAQMPTFRAAFSSPEFLSNNFTRPYAIIWPLLLQTSCNSASPQKNIEDEAGQELVAILKEVLKFVEDDTCVYKQYGFLKALVQLQWTLQLLAEATTARSSSSFKFWRRGGSVDKAINHCQVALGGVSVLEAESRCLPASSSQDGDGKKSQADNTGAHSSSLDDHDDEKNSGEKRGSSEADVVASKTKEVLSRILLLLKQLSVLTKGSRGAKID